MEWEIWRFCHQIHKVWHMPGSSRLGWPACRTAQLSVKNQVASPSGKARGCHTWPDSQADKGGQQFPLFLLLLFLRSLVCIFFLKIFQFQSLHDDLSKCVISTKLNLCILIKIKGFSLSIVCELSQWIFHSLQGHHTYNPPFKYPQVLPHHSKILIRFLHISHSIV